MSTHEIRIWVRYRATHDETIQQCHIEFMKNMSEIDKPLGFKGLELPKTPICGENLSASFSIKGLTKGLKFFGSYIVRNKKYLSEDSATKNDFILYEFKTTNKFIDYKKVLHEFLPEIIVAYRGYKAFVSYGSHAMHYDSGGDNGYDENGYAIETNEIYNQLRRNKNIEIDGRNNIYRLHPAQYWDNQLCRRALGYDSGEVIKRLTGKVIRVDRLLDGFYLVLNDDPNLTYDEYVSMNEKIKPILGLI